METIKAWLKWLRDLLKGHEQANAPATPPPVKPTPVKPTPVKPTPKQSEPYVFVTVKGKKYHWDRLCPCLRNANEIKMDISKARKAGYTACDKCCSAAVHWHD